MFLYTPQPSIFDSPDTGGYGVREFPVHPHLGLSMDVRIIAYCSTHCLAATYSTPPSTCLGTIQNALHCIISHLLSNMMTRQTRCTMHVLLYTQ
jgi:hypothetical protein